MKKENWILTTKKRLVSVRQIKLCTLHTFRFIKKFISFRSKMNFFTYNKLKRCTFLKWLFIFLVFFNCERDWRNPNDPDVFPNPSFFDDFNDGYASEWDGDDIATYRVENGEYSIESRDDGLQHWSWRAFSTPGNFLLQTNVKYISGRTDELYGIGFFDTVYDRSCFWICKIGWYSLQWFSNQNDVVSIDIFLMNIDDFTEKIIIILEET